MKTLEQVLIDTESELPVLRKHGATQVADAIERLLEEVRETAAPFLTWLSEQEAMLQANKSQAWLRARFAAWETLGLARKRNNARQYLKLAIPVAIDLEAVRADARKAAGEHA